MTRLETLPTIPAVSEFLPGYEVSTSSGIGVSTGTASSIVNKLNQEINAGLADPKLRARLTDLGCTPMPGSSAEFGTLIADETEKWRKLILAAKIKFT